MSRRVSGRAMITSIVVLWLGFGNAVSAQTSVPASGSRDRRSTMWTAVGAGAGFGVGVWAGLHAFDDSVNSDRKVWTTAALSAAAGGILGYLLSRDRSKPSAQRSGHLGPLGTRVVPTRDAPRLGSGTFRAWIELRASAGRGVSSTRHLDTAVPLRR